MKAISILCGQNRTSGAASSKSKSSEGLIRVESICDMLPSKINEVSEKIWRSELPWQEKLLLILLLKRGLRVSEIADPENIYLTGQGGICVYAKKQKQFKEVRMIDEWSRIDEDGMLEYIRGWKRSRQYYYRILEKYITFVPSQRKKNNPVTHAARNLIAQQAWEVNKDIHDVQDAIGVKSESAAARYLTPHQRREYDKILKDQRDIAARIF